MEKTVCSVNAICFARMFASRFDILTKCRFHFSYKVALLSLYIIIVDFYQLYFFDKVCIVSLFLSKSSIIDLIVSSSNFLNFNRAIQIFKIRQSFVKVFSDFLNIFSVSSLQTWNCSTSGLLNYFNILFLICSAVQPLMKLFVSQNTRSSFNCFSLTWDLARQDPSCAELSKSCRWTEIFSAFKDKIYHLNPEILNRANNSCSI